MSEDRRNPIKANERTPGNGVEGEGPKILVEIPASGEVVLMKLQKRLFAISRSFGRYLDDERSASNGDHTNEFRAQCA
jgi:hypothetical protein